MDELCCIVDRYSGNAGIRRITYAEQFRVMPFAQLTWRESLRDIEVTLGANASKLYAMGLRHSIHPRRLPMPTNRAIGTFGAT